MHGKGEICIVVMFSVLAVQLLYSSPPLDSNNCTVLTSLCMDGADSPVYALRKERNASITCLRRFADATPDFGTRDSLWKEYAPTCATWDGVPFGVAEPLNSISALAFDELLCAANTSFAHTGISQLAFGTFAFHASGAHLFTSLLDLVPLYCLETQVLHQLMVKAGKGSLPVVMNGASYAVDTLASSCTASLSAVLEECNLDTMVPSLEAQLAQLPRSAGGYLVYAMHRACLEDPTAASLGLFPLEYLAAAGLPVADEIDSFADGLGFVAPGFEACEQHNLGVRAYAEAASFQGQAPGTVELHHRWHEKVAEALYHLGEVMALLPDQCSSDDECPPDSTCVCDDSKSPRRRRALLFATSPRARARPASASERVKRAAPHVHVHSCWGAGGEGGWL